MLPLKTNGPRLVLFSFPVFFYISTLTPKGSLKNFKELHMQRYDSFLNTIANDAIESIPLSGSISNIFNGIGLLLLSTEALCKSA